MEKKKILVCAMNWGLGHAARCIPIIWELQKRGLEPILASDGPALLLLQKEFPHLKSFELPSYNIRYTSRPKMLKWKLFLQTPHILRTIHAERKMIFTLVKEEGITGIISDNRFGAHAKTTKNVYITHQLNVLSGKSTFFSSKLHQKYIKKFDECWVPDSPGKENLSGILGHPKKSIANVKHIGALSRFKKNEVPLKYDYLVLLSGPEPQRSLLETILLKSFKDTEKKILFVRGVVSNEPFRHPESTIAFKNYLFGQELEEVINSSKTIISRSGYTTIMDLAKLEKKAFFIPTPGQYEQEYLAERLMVSGIAPYCKQEDFEVSRLETVMEYSGLRDFGGPPNFGDLFALFEGE